MMSSRSGSQVSASPMRNLRLRVEYGDFANRADVERALSGANVAFHLVSGTLPHTSVQDPSLEISANILPSLGLIEASAHAAGLEQLVFVSSGGTIYGQPAFLPISEEHRTNHLPLRRREAHDRKVHPARVREG